MYVVHMLGSYKVSIFIANKAPTYRCPHVLRVQMFIMYNEVWDMMQLPMPASPVPLCMTEATSSCCSRAHVPCKPFRSYTNWKIAEVVFEPEGVYYTKQKRDIKKYRQTNKQKTPNYFKGHFDIIFLFFCYII